MAKSYYAKITLVFILFFVIFPSSICRANDAKEYFMRGYAYININEPDEAIDRLNKAIALSPAYAAAYRERGFAYYLKSMHLKAIIDYQKAIELNSQDALAWNNLGLAYHAMRAVTLSKQAITKAIELNPDYAQAHLNLVHIYWLEGETGVFTDELLKKIRYHLKEYSRIMPDSVIPQEVRDKISWVDKRTGSGSLVINESRQAKELSKKNAEQAKSWVHDELPEDLLEKEHITLGIMFLRGNFLEAAAREFEEVVGINPENANAFMILGAIYLKLGKHDKAVSSYAAALTINSQTEQTNFGLGKAYLSENNIQEAEKQIQILKEKNSALAEVLEKEINEIKNKQKKNQAEIPKP